VQNSTAFTTKEPHYKDVVLLLGRFSRSVCNKGHSPFVIPWGRIACIQVST